MSIFMNEDESVDDLLKGRLKIIQRKRGYRFSLDAVLLAHFSRVEPGERVFDLGTGSGVIPLILAGCSRPQEIIGLEIQDDLADMADRSVRLNNLQDVIKIVSCDVNTTRMNYQPGICDVTVCNPPYRKVKSGKINPDVQKAIARHELKGKLEDFLAAAAYLMRPFGRCYVIYKVLRMAELFASLKINGIEPKRMRIVHSKFQSEGEFVLVEGCKGGGEELQMMPPLIIYENNGSYTSEMREIFESLEASSDKSFGD